MNDKKFVDSNIAIYALETNGINKDRALSLLTEGPQLSTQVILEVVNICLKKLSYSKEEAYTHARYLVKTCALNIITENTINRAFDLSLRYNFPHWDSVILASALEAECSIFYSEDFQHGQVIEGMKIVNPFL
jgi:predicted nucleic acid-binding protein